ncbi:hypothetical protein GQ55_9G617400 [Panicum hallii var. hallii]|uniref:Uncharacterized protein n=1 Tax=Panicum hallii var. hallii TaxID=1504633 RepID=A0A2T7CHR9_9POAL|nr:hypothetical protein GQ55_9G617400 [Panicum hallii var. hallii]
MLIHRHGIAASVSTSAAPGASSRRCSSARSSRRLLPPSPRRGVAGGCAALEAAERRTSATEPATGVFGLQVLVPGTAAHLARSPLLSRIRRRRWRPRLLAANPSTFLSPFPPKGRFALRPRPWLRRRGRLLCGIRGGGGSASSVCRPRREAAAAG